MFYVSLLTFIKKFNHKTIRVVLLSAAHNRIPYAVALSLYAAIDPLTFHFSLKFLSHSHIFPLPSYTCLSLTGELVVF